MRIRGLGVPKRMLRRALTRLFPGTVILLYHRVADLAQDPFGLAVAPAHFREHLSVIRRYSRPISLRQLLSELRNGKLPRRTVAVTFDDGYADNLYAAKPLLEQSDVPATFSYRRAT